MYLKRNQLQTIREALAAVGFGHLTIASNHIAGLLTPIAPPKALVNADGRSYVFCGGPALYEFLIYSAEPVTDWDKRQGNHSRINRVFYLALREDGHYDLAQAG